MANTGLRKIKIWKPEIAMETRDDGSILVWRKDPLADYPHRLTDLLIKWAEKTPDRTWLAQRDESGDWRKISYGEALVQVERIAQSLIELDLSPERPLLILSEKGIEHGLIALAAQHVGIPSAAIAPAYSLVAKDFLKLRDIEKQLTPGLIYAEDGQRFQTAIDAVFDQDVPVVSRHNPVTGREAIEFDALSANPATSAVGMAHEKVGRDTIAKFLFTSGTTGSPKAVIQSHGMIAANQTMVQDCFAFLAENPPIVVDWAPWNHTAAGNKVFYMVLFNGGTFYMDEGKPSPDGIKETIRNLRDVSPTWYFNVPAGYEMLIGHMERDAELRQSFFSKLDMLMYAGAAMPQHLWERISEMAVETVGERILLASSLGSTETAPFALMCMEEQEKSGNIGIPAQGITLKLVPQDGKLEARLKGPSMTPGYWRNPALTAEAFDDEGFYQLGDALKFAVEGEPIAGFFFDGRTAENFKLTTGTWVSVGALRAQLVDGLDGLVRDAVITGENRGELGAILIPFIPALRGLVSDEEGLSDAEILAHDTVRSRISDLIDAHAIAATGSASRVKRVVFFEGDPSFDAGEVTDKGSINQRAVLRNHTPLVEALYGDDPRVIHAS